MEENTKNYMEELKSMIKSRTGAECEPWLISQIRVTAYNMVVLDKVMDELVSLNKLVTEVTGSRSQEKTEVTPLLSLFDKLQRTLILQYEALGLNYKTTPSKVKEDTRKGVSESDGLMKVMKAAKDGLDDMDNFIEP